MNNMSGTMNSGPLISVVIATFNSERDIRGCIRSIASQEYKNIEIVVADGASTDNTVAILKELSETHRITFTSQPDKGIYDALNRGAQMAKGDWLHFLGSDDRLLPGFSELAQKLEDPNAVYYGNTTEFVRKGIKPVYTLLTGKFTTYRLAKECMNHQAILYPARVFKLYSYNLRYKVYADYVVNLHVWGNSSFKKLHFPITIASYNMSGFSTMNVDPVFIKEKPTIIRKSMGWVMYFRWLYKRYRKRRKDGIVDYY
ncbi:glycosyltransferase family 2 protein [Chitinophaga nivalis]|uniref:Glycosyltransferase n=1 Tax=Chitinophaga nivalis TaxID=2991709 RepID=A0ABT3IQT2_9BACT|nr:glycosyltransferase family 2 protein [Chitinophaga nivalis]MCW3463977.1 glycosyltransferase [Chitinophaga nivalis]MCW3486333.1 glycosyltransferase [Chitinophaga nivalis]